MCAVMSTFFTVAAWLVSLFVAGTSETCGLDCLQSTDEADTSAIDTVCHLPDQELTLPDTK